MTESKPSWEYDWPFRAALKDTAAAIRSQPVLAVPAAFVIWAFVVPVATIGVAVKKLRRVVRAGP